MAKNWNIKTLKEHYDSILKLRKAKLKEKFRSMQLAISKSEEFYKGKFENTNEWRETVTGMQGEYAKKVQVDILQKAIERIEGRKEGGNLILAYIISIISLIIAVIAALK